MSPIQSHGRTHVFSQHVRTHAHFKAATIPPLRPHCIYLHNRPYTPPPQQPLPQLTSRNARTSAATPMLPCPTMPCYVMPCNDSPESSGRSQVLIRKSAAQFVTVADLNHQQNDIFLTCTPDAAPRLLAAATRRTAVRRHDKDEVLEEALHGAWILSDHPPSCIPASTARPFYPLILRRLLRLHRLRQPARNSPRNGPGHLARRYVQVTL